LLDAATQALLLSSAKIHGVLMLGGPITPIDDLPLKRHSDSASRGVGNAGMDYWRCRNGYAILAFLYSQGPISYTTAGGKFVDQHSSSPAEWPGQSINGITSVKARSRGGHQ